MYITTIAPIGAIFAVSSGSIDFSFPRSTWIYLIGGGLLFGAANILAFSANTKVEASQYSILANFNVITTLVISGIFLGERLSGLEFMGVGLILLSTIVIASQKFNRKTFKLEWYTLLALLSSMFLGAGVSNQQYILGSVNYETYLLIGWGFQALILACIANKQLLSYRQVLGGKNGAALIGLGILRTLSGIVIVYAFAKSGNSSLVSGIIAYKTALVVIGSYLFFLLLIIPIGSVGLYPEIKLHDS